MDDKTLKCYQVDVSDIPLMEYTNIFVANMAFMKRGLGNAIATFDLVVRDLPPRWNYFIMHGIDRFLAILEAYRFDDDALALLEKMGFLNSPELKNFYKSFSFTGDVRALRDGTLFFPGEPIVRITAPLLEANILTAFLLNSFSYPIRVLTKGARLKEAAKDKMLMLAVTRIPGFEQSIFASKTAFFFDAFPHVAPIFTRKFPEFPPPSKFTVNVNHAVIKSFPSEKEAFQYALKELLPGAASMNVMVDTYHFEHGLSLFIRELSHIGKNDWRRVIVTIDSGDLYKRAVYARKTLDKAKMQDVGIVIASNLDEYSISRYMSKKIPVSLFVAVTEFVNTSDAPKLEIIYKMAELRRTDGTVEQKAKLAKGKESYPGRKQVFRTYDKKGKMVGDIIGLEDENLGEPLLQKFIENGKLVKPLPTLGETKKYLHEELAKLPHAYKDVNKQKIYPVSISKGLRKMLAEVKKKHGGEILAKE